MTSAIVIATPKSIQVRICAHLSVSDARCRDECMLRIATAAFTFVNVSILYSLWPSQEAFRLGAREGGRQIRVISLDPQMHP